VARPVRLTAHRATARGLPPELPLDEVESIPFFGRTWYVRGVGYHFRRVVAALLWLVTLVVATVIVYDIFDFASTVRSVPGRWGWRAGFAVLLIVSLIRPAQAFVKGERARRAGELLRPRYVPGMRERRPGGGVAVGAMARVGNPVAVALLVISAIFFYGWFLLQLYAMLRPEPDLEYDARRRLQQREHLRQLSHRGDIPGTAPKHHPHEAPGS
jgi:hypothetical protein